jgi:hypothetical protein
MRSMDDGITGRISLEKIDTNGRPSTCDTCRTRPALYELHWFDSSAPVRGLCQRCADSEFTTYQFDMARRMPQERERILDAELHGTAEALAQLAEGYDGYYSQFVPPPFVAAFIARHYKTPDWRGLIEQGISPDTTDAGEAIDPIDLAAARLAFLILRGSLSHRGDVRADAYVMRDPDRLLSPDAAARLLARIPKPIRCKGVLLHGHMGVALTAVKERGQLEWPDDNEHEELLRKHGPEYGKLPLYCAGTGESIVIPVAALEAFRRDYSLQPYGYGITTLESHATHDPAGARTARNTGAIEVLTCGDASSSAQESGEVIPLHRKPWEATSVLERTTRGAACQCGSPASWMLTDTSTSPWSERPYCAECAAALVADVVGTEAFEQWITARHRDSMLSAYERRVVLDQLLRPWQHLPMPPAIADLAARARALL